jgi:hypothetical protein
VSFTLTTFTYRTESTSMQSLTEHRLIVTVACSNTQLNRKHNAAPQVPKTAEGSREPHSLLEHSTLMKREHVSCS